MKKLLIVPITLCILLSGCVVAPYDGNPGYGYYGGVGVAVNPVYVGPGYYGGYYGGGRGYWGHDVVAIVTDKF